MMKKTEVNDVAPSSVAHVVGQQGVVEQVKVALDAAFEDTRRFDHAMLVGPPGMGKSMTANVIAQEMAADFHEVLGQSIANVGDLNGLLLQASDKSVVHIDEAHELNRKLQTALYLATDKRRIFISGSKAVQSIPIADFTLLLSTTDEYSLLQPLRDRMRLVLHFDFYSSEDLATLLHHRSKALGWSVDEGLLPHIARRSKGTPRLALRLLQACRRVCRSEGEDTLTCDHLHRACNLERIDELGLGPTEQAYLRILSDGPTRLNVIASSLGLPPKTISAVTEPFLIRAGLTSKDDQSRRQLTSRGYEHLSESSP
ncbi:MAG: AAA family ATPase [Candidatus Nealsonbacteria bacterium]|nr:AAA family ATPase [Candidatus Nealsonbacteria bacterium]